MNKFPFARSTLLRNIHCEIVCMTLTRCRFSSLDARVAKLCSFLMLGWLVYPAGNGHAQVVVAIGQNFTAATFNVDSPFRPPDSNGAVGPLHFVEFINGRFSVFNKSDGAKVKTMTDMTFWS